MVRGSDNSREWRNETDGGRPDDGARDQLDEAVTELRRLADDQLFQSVERLCDIDGIREGGSVSVETVRRLRLRSADYLRLAAELEAAARCCRLIEQELRQQIEAGHLTPMVGKTYPLPDVPQAIRHLEDGRAQGKIAITVACGGRQVPTT